MGEFISPSFVMVYRRIFPEQLPFVEVDCVSFKEQLESLEHGADILDENVNRNFQCSSEEDLEVAMENPMGLLFVSRLESGVDFHNPLFSNVAERLGLDRDFNPISTEES